MQIRFFGQYLLENRAITAEQLLAAIALQERTNRKFGEIAVSLGLLTEGTLAEVLTRQRTCDLRTGEAAVQLGFLTSAQVEQVLRAQRNSHVLIGEALVELGALPREALERHLAAFRAEEPDYEVAEPVPAQLAAPGLAAPAVDLVMKLLLRVAGLRSKLVAYRLGEPAPVAPDTMAAHVDLTGDAEMELALSAPRLVCSRIASGIAGEIVAPVDHSLLMDGLKEFLNLVGGNLCAVAARVGTKVEVGVPMFGGLLPAAPSDRLLVALLRLPDGDMEVALMTRH
jgi:hypothetical protein